MELSKCISLNTKFTPLLGTGDVGEVTVASVASWKGIEETVDELSGAASDQLFKDYQPYGSHPRLPVFDGGADGRSWNRLLHFTGCYETL